MVHPGPPVRGLKPNRPRAIGNRLGKFPEVTVGDAAVVVGQHEMRIQTDGLVIVREGPPVLRELLIHRPAIVEGGGVLGIEAQ